MVMVIHLLKRLANLAKMYKRIIAVQFFRFYYFRLLKTRDLSRQVAHFHYYLLIGIIQINTANFPGNRAWGDDSVRTKHGHQREAWWNSEPEGKKPDKMQRQNYILGILVLIIMAVFIFDMGGITTYIINILSGSWYWSAKAGRCDGNISPNRNIWKDAGYIHRLEYL